MQVPLGIARAGSNPARVVIYIFFLFFSLLNSPAKMFLRGSIDLAGVEKYEKAGLFDISCRFSLYTISSLS